MKIERKEIEEDKTNQRLVKNAYSKLNMIKKKA